MKSFKVVASAVGCAVANAQPEVPQGTIFVPMVRDAAQAAYMAEFFVGTPPQRHWLKVDSGSPTYSFISSNNAACLQSTRPCETYGSFDNTTSSTSIWEGPGFHNALNNHGQGDFLNDTVTIGNVSTPHLYFGFTTFYGFLDRVANPAYSVVGLSLDCLGDESTCGHPGPYLLPELKSASSIDYMSASIYLGPDDADTKNAHVILGAAYDAAKVDGDFFTVDMVNPRIAIGQTNSVNVTALEVIAESNRTSATYGPKDIGSPVLLDTGVASWYLPSQISEAIYQAFGGIIGGFNIRTPYQKVDCRNRDPEYVKGSVTVEFGQAGKISVSLHELVTKFADGTCATYVQSRGETVSIFGDAFLRSVYSIFDQEKFVVYLAQAKHTSEQNLVPLPEGGFRSAR